MRIFPAYHDDFEELWDRVGPMLDQALQRTSGHCLYSLDDVKLAISERSMQLWVVVDGGQILAAVVTQVHNFPQARILNVFLMGGSRMEEWLDRMVELLTVWGEVQGCTYYSGSGRAGWGMKLRKEQGIKIECSFVAPLGEYNENEVYH